MRGVAAGNRWRRWWPWLGGLVGVVALAWVFSRLDYGRLFELLAYAHPGYLALVPLTIAVEQVVRAWKWRQILHPIRPARTTRLFGAIMAGYFANLLIPLGVNPLVRSWLLARLEQIRMSTVLATVVIDRLIDGVVFAGFVALVVVFAVFPDPAGGIRRGLVVGGVASFILFVLLLLAFAAHKRQVENAASWTTRLVARLPSRFAERARGLSRGFAAGIVWPRAAWRRAGIVLASVLMKLIAATHLLFAGLAFGVLLQPMAYLFLMVFLGFTVILARFAQVPGGFILGAAFALDLLGVDQERALAMALVVLSFSLATVAVIGGIALWRAGVTVAELRAAGTDHGGGG